MRSPFFPQKLRCYVFAGIGEPLLHRDIAKMVRYAVNRDIAERIDIVTNGLCLNNSISNELADSGLTTLRISVNGLSESDYLKNTKTKIDFEQFITNIGYFFKKNELTKIYIKIIDYMVPTSDTKKKFFVRF
jgi:Predicted Fe-S oxidoreductases